MQYFRGRTIDHVHLRVADLDATERFYRAALGALGATLARGTAGDEPYLSFDELWVTAGPKPTTGLHLAFQAKDRETVAKFHAAALAAGGKDNGTPGERNYHPGYYAAFVLDPDGNNIEAVYHGPSERSAESVVFTVG